MSETTRTPSRWITAGVAVVVLGGAGIPAALASGHDPKARNDHASARVITHEPANIDLVRTQIYAYYGDPGKTGTASRQSGYGYDMGKVEAKLSHLLKQRQHWRYGGDKKTVLFDVDDTTLLTYPYEIASNFAYDPVENAKWVLGEKFPQTFGMVKLVRQAKRMGYDVVYLTGRPSSQQDATIGNLTKVGYPTPDAIYTRDKANPPDYMTCAPDCSTIDYKSLTRKHINATGNHIVANVGDQFSDLAGGFADKTFKLPNPMYYLP
jgi:hypothetical protein